LGDFLLKNAKNLEMKSLFTTLLLGLTTLLTAQTVSFEPATSLMDDNVTASIDNAVYTETATVEVSNEFNLDFETDAYYGDIVISYNLSSEAAVKLEVEKAGTTVISLVNGTQSTGTQEVLWDENLESGKYTIRLMVGSKVQTKTINLSL